MHLSPARARQRGKVAALTRAVNNGERPKDCPELDAARKEHEVLRLAEHAEILANEARKLVADWPDLNDEQLGRIAGILTAAGAA